MDNGREATSIETPTHAITEVAHRRRFNTGEGVRVEANFGMELLAL
jgi:hypothetical protein